MFPKWMRGIGKVVRESREAIFVQVPLSRLERALASAKKHGAARISSITGYDTGKELGLVYTLVHAGLVLNIKVRLDRKKPEVPSVREAFPSAHLYEMENHEMFGIEFRGNNDMKPVLLAEDSPKCPLFRKEEKNAAKGK